MKNFSANKLDNLAEVNKFLERHKLSELKKQKNLNKLVTNKKIELSKQEISHQEKWVFTKAGFTGSATFISKVCQTFKELT